MKKAETVPDEDIVFEEESAAEDLEPEEPALAVLDADDQEVNEDPLRTLPP